MSTTIRYYIRDAKEGLQRNAGAAIAACILIVTAMLILGTLLIIRSGADGLVKYLESQINMKIYIDPSLDVNEMAAVLEKQSYVESVDVETKDELLERLAVFFQGREHLLEAFRDSAIPDAVTLELKDRSQIERIATELESSEGIVKIVYPQQFASTLFKASGLITRYGMALLVFFTGIALLTAALAIHLSLHQRQQEIRVKLLLGAHPFLVRGQFLFEGGLIGLIGSLIAVLVIYGGYSSLLIPLQGQFTWLLSVSITSIYPIMGIIVLMGPGIGLIAAYLSTRKLIRDA